MTVSDRSIYGCRCCAWESQGRPRAKSAARRMIKRRERAAWKKEVFG